MRQKSELDLLRVDNVGSMLRPPALKAAFEHLAAGDITSAELSRVQDEAITTLVARQEEHDFPLVVDGEFRRTSFMESFADVSGFDAWSRQQAEVHRSRSLSRDGLEKTEAPSAMTLTPATEILKLRHNRPLDEYRFTQGLTERPVKATLIGPDRIYQCYDEANSKESYEDIGAFLQDVIEVERQIVAELVEAGCRYVHMDAPGFTAYVDPGGLERMRRRGLDPAVSMSQTIQAENAVIADFPDSTFAIHICRGNERSHWHREGTYDSIAEQLFSGLDHDRYLLEYDSERAGDFRPLRFVPKGKVVVLGLVTTKVGRLESVDELCRRVDEAARYVPVEQLAISPQCGFASSIEGNTVTEADQWAKLDLVLEVAHKIWG